MRPAESIVKYWKLGPIFGWRCEVVAKIGSKAVIGVACPMSGPASRAASAMYLWIFVASPHFSASGAKVEDLKTTAAVMPESCNCRLLVLLEYRNPC